METEGQEGQQAIEGQQSPETPDSNLLNRLAAWCRNLVRAVLPKESQREKEKERLLAEIKQINIEGLCLLSSEDFLESPQFFKLFELYNLFRDEDPIDAKRLQNNMVARFVVDAVLDMFIRLRSHLTEDLQRASALDQFRNKVLKYLDERGGQQEPEVREECVSLSADQSIGVSDTTRRFRKLGVVLQTDDDIYGDWYVSINSRRCKVDSSYGQELNRMTQGQMVLIERAFRSHVLDAEEFIHILMRGQPYFNELIESIIDRLSKI